MSRINQHSILKSVRDSLVPGASLIDGRTEADWLRFLSDFAALINFYDQDNKINGNWEPFLLKDPVFMIAVISRTEYAKMYALYLRTCYKLEQLIQHPGHSKDLPVSFNQLFDQLTRIFIQIKEWTAYLQRSAMEFPLKTYLIQQIKSTFAGYLQAIFSLRQEMYSNAIIAGIDPADPVTVEGFEGYAHRIWKDDQFQRPYLSVLGLTIPIKSNTVTDIFKSLTNVGAALFNFLKIIIQQASAEFNRLTAIKSSYPDTTLLRTFINLLSVQQDQLNQITGKHLSFYYKNILKQAELPAVADRAFVIAGLLKKDLTLNLPAGTLFDAGTDTQKKPIAFESTEDVILNPATIPAAYTLSAVPGSNGLTAFQLQTIPNPAVVQKDAAGNILSWDTLGSAIPAAFQPVSMGFAFASPMLLLREGTRNITITIGYTGSVDLNMLQQAPCFLSTLQAWYAVDKNVQLAGTSSATTIIITITLKDTDPPIERFLVNPDGLESAWPMFKMVFNQVTSPVTAVPALHSLQIDVEVTGVNTFQLYNDYGALSIKVAYPLFGPMPLSGSNFIIGSNELFSKPLGSLTVQLNWSVLPPDFALYYQAYNLYIQKQLRISYIPPVSWLAKIFGKKKPAQPAIPEETTPYNNTCFTVNFQVLEMQNWKTVVFNTVNSAPAQAGPAQPAPNLLFIPDQDKLCTISTYCSTNIPVQACNPALQNQPLKFTEASTAGFMKMALCGPEYGFGSAIYPNVVSAVTLYNSQLLYSDDNVVFVAPASVPFAPKLKSISAAYKASVHYVLNKASTGYPLQYFLYAPFENYPVYDSLNQPPPQRYTIGGSEMASNDLAGLPLYAPSKYKSFLYLQIDNLIPAGKFNLYFELAPKYVTSIPADGGAVDYYYVSTAGWEPLTVLSDGTNKLTCSGIVSVNIPEDITKESTLMPGKSYWITIAANDISAVANTVLLGTNGIPVQRSGKAGTNAFTIPAIGGNAITKTKNVIPQISTVQQPFPSFGGKAAEDEQTRNLRVSTRIKTKDRAVTATDYFSLIRQQFNDIYDATSAYDSDKKITFIYVVNAVKIQTAANAFLPLVSISQQEQIQLFIQQKTSAFSLVQVVNPAYQSVAVYAVITVSLGDEFSAVQQRVNQALNIYLSPWIKDSGMQTVIYKDITDMQVSAFIKTINGVAAVNSVSFKTWMYNDLLSGQEKNAPLQQTVLPLKTTTLFIPQLVHQISLNPVVR